MGLVKTALIGAAVYGAFKYLTKKDELTGLSKLDDIKERAPEWMDKLKSYTDEVAMKFNYPDGRYGE